MKPSVSLYGFNVFVSHVRVHVRLTISRLRVTPHCNLGGGVVGLRRRVSCGLPGSAEAEFISAAF